MEKFDFVNNGVVKRLPPGFRFHPTDEELVVQYLKRKVLSHPLPANIIQEFDVCKSDPWDLPGNLEEERYFFSRNEAKYVNGERSRRATGSGYWKASGKNKQIVSNKNNQVVGMKKTLVFYKGKPRNGNRTEWIMHEYRLSRTESSKKNSTQSSIVPMKNWLLCHIFSKKRSTKNNMMQELSSINDEAPVFYNFMKEVSETDLNLPPPTLSSSSSGVTEISCNELGGQEEISSSSSSHSTRRRL